MIRTVCIADVIRFSILTLRAMILRNHEGHSELF